MGFLYICIYFITCSDTNYLHTQIKKNSAKLIAIMNSNVFIYGALKLLSRNHIKSSEIMSRQTTVDSLLLSVAAGQPSDSIAIVCSNESTFLAKSTIAYCMHNNIGFHWQMSNVSPQTVIAARTIFIVTWLRFGRTLNMACTDDFTTLPSVT